MREATGDAHPGWLAAGGVPRTGRINWRAELKAVVVFLGVVPVSLVCGAFIAVAR